MHDSQLLTNTVSLLRARRGQYRKIAAGADVDYHWLQSVAQGRIADPGVRKIERLHNYLSQQTEVAQPASE